ncbi:MAG: hypothetical protein ACJA0M_000327 [Chitinophagales bacterium]|jgi:uncharacterized protein (TIGR00369 family)
MNVEQAIVMLNDQQLPFLKMLGGRVVNLDPDQQTCSMEFDVSTDFCHSVNVVQGGFVTAMLDAVMSHAIFGLDDSIVNVSSLEIKTSFLEPTRAGKIIATGKIIKAGYKIGFMEGQLYNVDGELTATASSVGKLIRKPA